MDLVILNAIPRNPFCSYLSCGSQPEFRRGARSNIKISAAKGRSFLRLGPCLDAKDCFQEVDVADSRDSLFPWPTYFDFYLLIFTNDINSRPPDKFSPLHGISQWTSCPVFESLNWISLKLWWCLPSISLRQKQADETIWKVRRNIWKARLWSA